MANSPRTHTGTTVGNEYITVELPKDWGGGTRVAVVDLTDLPPGLTPNINSDGTYYGSVEAVEKAGWQWRPGEAFSWEHPDRLEDRNPTIVVQARPAPQPPTERIPWHQAVGRKLPDGTDIYSVTKAEDELYILTAAPNEGYEQTDLNPDRMVEVLVDSDDNQETSEPPTYPTCKMCGCQLTWRGECPRSRDHFVIRPGGGDR
jgi:hypothetical protein